MDAQQPLAPPGGMPLAMAPFTVERDVVVLCRQARAFGERFGMRDQDVRTLSAAIYDGARRLREAGGQGEAEFSVGNGPSLQVVFRVIAPADVIESLPALLSPLRAMLRGLRVACAPDSATVYGCLPLPEGVPAQVPAIPTILPTPANGPITAGALLGTSVAGLAPEPSDPASAELTSMLLSELDEANLGVVALCADLTEQAERQDAAAERVTLQKRVDRRAGDVAAMNRAIEDFLATLSHELRTPLNAILGWTRLLRMGYLDPAGTVRALDALERNALVQAQLVADILDASRIVTGRLQLDVQPVNIAGIIDAAVDFLKPHADAKRITLEINVEFRGHVTGDPERLQQVVTNLLSNAIKFTPDGGSIRVSLVQTDGCVTLTVADTGHGIDRAFLPFVFERFRQGDTSVTRSHGGLGLGLSIVRHVVELHGGRVDVASDGPGRGSCFSVHLPAVR